MKWTNEISRSNGVTTISIYRADEFMGDVLIDTADDDMICNRKWRIRRYPITTLTRLEACGSARPIELHRLLCPAPQGLECDHVNRNKLDNRRTNLRHVDHATNQRNQDKWENSKGRIDFNGTTYQVTWRNKYVGCFPTREDAAAALESIRHGATADYRQYRQRGFGSISRHSTSPKLEARYRGKYLGLFETVESAQNAIDTLRKV